MSGGSPYNPQITSPPYMFPESVGTGSSNYQPNPFSNINSLLLPSTSSGLGNSNQHPPLIFNQNQNWLNPINQTNDYIVVEPVDPPPMNIPPPTNDGVGSITDLDSQELLQINTEELVSCFNEQETAERFSNNLTLNDNNRMDQRPDIKENMTDSFTRLANDTLNHLLQNQ